MPDVQASPGETVICPHPPCHAPVYHPCFTASGGIATRPHKVRLEAERRERDAEGRYLPPPYLPVDVDDIRMVFAADTSHLTPRVAFAHKTMGWGQPGDPEVDPGWVRFASDMWAQGLDGKSEFEVRDGIDPRLAFRHLHTVLKSWEFSQEYKIRAASLLASTWFTWVRYAGSPKEGRPQHWTEVGTRPTHEEGETDAGS